jgi:hypothetical protein
MSNIYTWGDVLRASFQDIWIGVVNFVPSFLAAVVLLLVGWLIAILLGKLVAQVIKTIKLDTALRGAGFDKVVEKGGFELNSGAFIGALVKWFFIVVALVASLDILNLNAVTSFLKDDVLGYLPKVIIATLILLVSIVIAQAIQKLVVSSAKAANIHAAGTLGVVAKWAILAFAVLQALSNLIDIQIILSFLGTILMGVVAALALAFGLGGKEAAARFIEKMQNK